MRVIERFKSKIIPVTETGCWLWSGAVNSRGYPFIKIDGSTVRAHRFSYENYVGDIPDGEIIRHKCDVSICVNPSHLCTGTNADNSNDMKVRGRSLVGSKNPASKLSEEDVLSIRFDDREYKVIADEYNVSLSTIKKIKAKIIWGWL